MQPGGNGGQEEPPGKTSTVQFLHSYSQYAFKTGEILLLASWSPYPCYSLFCGQIDSS